MSEKPREAEHPVDGLERLLEVEARIDERLAACRAEADEIVRAARADVAGGTERLDRELKAERARRLAARSAELEAEIREERDGAAATAKRLRAVPRESIDDLARSVVDRLLADPAGLP